MGICWITWKRRNKLSEKEAKHLFRQIATAVKFMKDNNILHRDLKPGNLFLTEDMQVKVGDFGCSAKLKSREERRNSQLGTPNYLPPEIYLRKEYNFSCDVWSIGCILYMLLVGKTPFESTSTKQTYRRILKLAYVIPEVLSKEAKDLLKKILVLDPDERITIEQILEHPFLKEEHKELVNIDDKLESGSLTVEQEWKREGRYQNNISSNFINIDLIVVEHVSEEMNMFLNPSELWEPIQDSSEPQMVPEKPEPDIWAPKLASKPHSASKLSSKTSKTPNENLRNKRSHSAKGRKLRSRVSKLRKDNGSKCEIIKEEDGEDEDDSFTTKQLKARYSRQTASNKILIKSKRLILDKSYAQENQAPNKMSLDRHFEAFAEQKLSKNCKNDNKQALKSRKVLEDSKGYHTEHKRVDWEVQPNSENIPSPLWTKGLSNFQHKTQNFQFTLDKSGEIQILIFKKNRYVVISPDGLHIKVVQNDSRKLEKKYT